MEVKHALVVTDWPRIPDGPAGDGHRQEWGQMMAKVRTVAGTGQAIRELREGVWQIDLGGEGLRPLLSTCSVLEENAWGYRVLFFDREPDWVETPGSRQK